MRRKPLTKEEERVLLSELAHSLAALRTPEEMMHLIVDLLSKPEVRMLARRLQVARLLIAGKLYREIRNELGVSSGTVARVATWLALSGAGYRMVIERSCGSEVSREERRTLEMRSRLWKDMRKKYPAYYWPQLLLEDILGQTRKRDRERLMQAIRKLNTKSALYKQLDAITRGWGVRQRWKKRA